MTNQSSDFNSEIINTSSDPALVCSCFFGVMEHGEHTELGSATFHLAIEPDGFSWVGPFSSDYSGSLSFLTAYNDNPRAIAKSMGVSVVQGSSEEEQEFVLRFALEGYTMRIEEREHVCLYLQSHPEAVQDLPQLRSRIQQLWGEETPIALNIFEDYSDGSEILMVSIHNRQSPEEAARNLGILHKELLTQHTAVTAEG